MAQMENAFISCTVQGSEVSGTILSLERLRVAFEAYHPNLIFRTSQILEELKIFINEELAYSGRAVITQLVYTGSLIACEAKLEEPGAQIQTRDLLNDEAGLARAYDAFIG